MMQKPYTGNGKPFVYAMYTQEDKDAVEAVLSALHEKGYELWPSERYEKQRIRKAALVLFFLSPAGKRGGQPRNSGRSMAGWRNARDPSFAHRAHADA